MGSRRDRTVKYTRSIGHNPLRRGQCKLGIKVDRVGKSMTPSPLTISAPHNLVLRNPLDESTNHRSQFPFDGRRTDNRANIDEDIGLDLVGKMIAMYTHSRRTGEFHSHTRRGQRSRLVAWTGGLLDAFTGLD